MSHIGDHDSEDSEGSWKFLGVPYGLFQMCLLLCFVVFFGGGEREEGRSHAARLMADALSHVNVHTTLHDVVKLIKQFFFLIK